MARTKWEESASASRMWNSKNCFLEVRLWPSLFFCIFPYLNKKDKTRMDRVRQIIGYSKKYDDKKAEGIGICILDSGITGHRDFDSRIVEFKDFVDGRLGCNDEYGHGTHIAGICAGSGVSSGEKYQGIAPKSKLIIGKILGRNGEGRIQDLLQGIRWCINNRKRYNIRILNISVGLIHSVNEKSREELMDLVEYAWDLGIVTVCAAGNNGPKDGSVTIPGSNAKVITVGSFEVQNNKRYPSRYSGRGPTWQCVLKPEIYAPGSGIVSCSHQGGYTKKTGTSMAVPVVTGGIALLIQRKPYITPVEVKIRLLEQTKVIGDLEGAHWRMFHLPDFLGDTKY